jgi:hypothetical protein
MGRVGLAIVSLFCALAAAPIARHAAADDTVVLGDFEADSQGWRYVGGEEFPGAKGAAARDTSAAHGGVASLKLTADFAGGGAYVGVWKDLPDLQGRDVTQVRIWAKTTNVSSLGARITDSSGQCHQRNDLRLQADGDWHELILPLSDLVGGEHWGGANDGKWHGPAKGFGLNIGRDALAQGAEGAVWLDDVVCAVSAAQLGHPTVLACTLSPRSCRPGFGAKLTYRWDAEPMGRDFSVFVHFVGPDGNIAFQDDHMPPVATAVWSGRVEYEHTIVVPMKAPEGRYRIMLGLYDHAAAERGWDRQKLNVGQGVQATEDNTSCQIGTLIVDAQAPLPKLGPPTLNLDGYHVTFAEEFTDGLDVSAWGPGTRWIAHTPYAGDFGDARFADPEEGFPFTVENGVLRIEAKNDGKGWRGGLLCSVDPKGNGFAQQYGYFEMRAKLPKGEGTWPAFWLLGLPGLKDKSLTNIEIDVLEEYGVNPNALHTTVHLWHPDGKHWADGSPSVVQGMTDDYHTYGVLVTAEDIAFYFDGVELRRVRTPDEAKVPLYVLVDLALGGGWPIDKTPNPSFLYVDYIRVYSK